MKNLQSPEFLKGLKRLSLISKHKFPGQRIGERKTIRKGHSVEFKDYKEYNPGDDIRFIDWNVWGRLDSFFVKIFYNEENQHIFQMLDLSRSMSFGSPSKWDFMLQFAAATSYVALASKDMVHTYPFGQQLLTSAPLCIGLGQYPRLVQHLQSLRPARESKLLQAVEDFLQRERRRGILFLVSDFFFEEEVLDTAFKKLAYFGFDVNVIQVLSPEEIRPDLRGFHALKDMETEKEMEIDIGTHLLSAYEQTLQEHLAMVEKIAKKYAFRYLFADSSQDCNKTVVQLLLQAQRGR